MSHKATNWAFEQRGLKPGPKLVLLCLADCHNPVHGCFPDQQFIADQCEISRRSVNTYLDELETGGFIRRLASVDPVSRKQNPTRYVLGFEDGFATGQAVDKYVDNQRNRVQDLHTEPCAKSAKNRVQNLHTNPVIKINRNTRAPAREALPVDIPRWRGEPEIRQAVVDDPQFGEAAAQSYVDTATPLPDGSMRAKTRIGAARLSACAALKARGIRVLAPP